MKQAIIIGGGKGTRLQPLTDETPKPMLLIGGIPHLEYQINLLKKYGYEEIIISTGYLHEQIVDYFEDGREFGVSIKYREDGVNPLGTAGAIKNCEDLIADNQVLILNGDILTNINLHKFSNEYHKYVKKNKGILMALAEVGDPSSFGVAQLDTKLRIKNFIEKPKDNAYGNLINAGIYMISKQTISNMPENKYWMFETDVFNEYVDNKKLYGFIEDYYWLDIGTHQRYHQANNDVWKGIFQL